MNRISPKMLRGGVSESTSGITSGGNIVLREQTGMAEVAMDVGRCTTFRGGYCGKSIKLKVRTSWDHSSSQSRSAAYFMIRTLCTTGVAIRQSQR